MPATFANPTISHAAVRLRSGRLALVLLGLLLLVAGGAYVVLVRWGTKVTPPPVATTIQPGWMKQAIAYPPEPLFPTKPEVTVDGTAELRQQLRLAQDQLAAQQEEFAVLKRRLAAQATPPPAPKPAVAQTPPPPPRKRGSMLFISHEVKEPPSFAAQDAEFVLAPSSKIPCIIETDINSDVPGHFTAKVTTNVYDTATGRHLLVSQGSTILGHDQSAQLVYGNERLDTVSLTLTLSDGRSVDLGRAPVTDQRGVAGLTGRVNQHYWRLFGAVFIGGALKGGMSAMSTAMTSAAGAGQVASGIASTGSQATNGLIGPALNTRPTIEVDDTPLCNVLVIKELKLPAMWAGGAPTTRKERIR